MPHQCTNCGRTFPDGSKEMLSGCPDCGGNKFQFEPSGGGAARADAAAASADANAASSGAADASASSEASTTNSSSDSGVSGTVSQAKRTVSDWVGRGDSSNADDAASTTADDATSTSTEDATSTSTEDAASASAENAASASTGDAASASADDRAGSDAAERSSASPGSQARRNADAGRSNIESTGDWPDVGSRDPTDDPTRSGDHPSRPDDRPSRPDDRPTPSDADLTRTPGNDVEASSRDSSGEDVAQASARSDVVDPNDLPSDAAAGSAATDRTASSGSDTSDHPLDGDRNGAPPDADDGEVVGTPDDEQPDLEALRQELNEQFESIKIVRPGEYELNLMELYDRDEYIISLMEDGRYAIEVPDAWRDGE